MIKEFLVGDTLKVTWVSSGTSPSQANHAIYNGAEVLVNSETMTDSGDGHWYSNYTVPNSNQNMVAETVVWVNSYPYKKRTPFKVTRQEVD